MMSHLPNTTLNRFALPAGITTGIVNIPSCDPAEAKVTCELLLEKDREEHHCFFNHLHFVNHLSHHLLSAFDLGASPVLLKAQYEDQTDSIHAVPIDTVFNAETKEKTGKYSTEKNVVVLDDDNWKNHLGDDRFYAPFLKFFSERIKTLGLPAVFHDYVWSEGANSDDGHMIWRLVSGLIHPLIQVGYGAEFNSPAMIAQGLAQAACNKPLGECQVNFEFAPFLSSHPPSPHSITLLPLLHVLRQFYESPALVPVPYNAEATIFSHVVAALKDGTRASEIRRLSALWWSCDKEHVTDEELKTKIEEIIWTTTLLLGGTSRKGYTPKVDFFLMHVLNCTIFLPSYMRIMEEKGELSGRRNVGMTRILKALIPMIFLTILTCGRPHIDAHLLMTRTKNPVPRSLQPASTHESQLNGRGEALAPNEGNPWTRIIEDVIHAKDCHSIKAIRTLYHAARMYGTTGLGRAPGAFQGGATVGNQDAGVSEETLPGSGRLDGTVYVRVAGLVMDRIGWVTYGEEQRGWDRSGLGWSEVWN